MSSSVDYFKSFERYHYLSALTPPEFENIYHILQLHPEIEFGDLIDGLIKLNRKFITELDRLSKLEVKI